MGQYLWQQFVPQLPPLNFYRQLIAASSFATTFHDIQAQNVRHAETQEERAAAPEQKAQGPYRRSPGVSGLTD